MSLALSVVNKLLLSFAGSRQLTNPGVDNAQCFVSSRLLTAVITLVTLFAAAARIISEKIEIATQIHRWRCNYPAAAPPPQHLHRLRLRIACTLHRRAASNQSVSSALMLPTKCYLVTRRYNCPVPLILLAARSFSPEKLPPIARQRKFRNLEFVDDFSVTFSHFPCCRDFCSKIVSRTHSASSAGRGRPVADRVESRSPSDSGRQLRGLPKAAI